MKTKDLKVIVDHKALPVADVKRLLDQSYWANTRTNDVIKKSLDNSICYAGFIDDMLIGFGRVVTDYSTMYWVCDIIIDENFRGNGYGKKIMEAIMQTQSLDGLLGILATKDAHKLYEKYGFHKNSDRFMKKARKI